MEGPVASASEVIDAGLLLPRESRVEYFATIADRLSRFSSSEISEASERARLPYKLFVLLGALAKDLFSNSDRYYAWYLATRALYEVRLGREMVACAVRALSVNGGPQAAAWAYIHDESDIPWRDARPETPHWLPAHEVVRVPERWARLDAIARCERLRLLVRDLAPLLPSSPTALQDLAKNLITVAELPFEGWRFPAPVVQAFLVCGSRVLVLSGGHLVWAVIVKNPSEEGEVLQAIDASNGAVVWLNRKLSAEQEPVRFWPVPVRRQPDFSRVKQRAKYRKNH
jgi:hypothetical protein